MLSKNRTLVLGVILVIVLALYLVLSYSGDHEKNFRTNLPVVDTATTNKVLIISSETEKPVQLTKQNGQWMVTENDRQYLANKSIVKSLIAGLSGAPVVSVAATSPDEWEKFKATDDLGTRVQFEKNGKKYLDILIGKFDYIQQKEQNPYTRQPQGEMLTYVRVNDGDEVYAIEGSLGLGMGKTADKYRSRVLLKADKNAVNKLQFNYIGGNNFSLTKENNQWKFDDGAVADSATMVKYLNILHYLSGRTLAEEDPEKQPLYAELKVISNEKDTVNLWVYTADTATSIILSSKNPTNPVKDEQNKIRDRAFVTKDYFKGRKE